MCATIANYARQQMAGLIADHPDVFEELRGQGLMIGLKMKVPNTEFVAALRAHHMLAVGAGDNVVRLLPPLIIEEAQVREAMAALEAAAKDMEAPARRVRPHERAHQDGRPARSISSTWPISTPPRCKAIIADARAAQGCARRVSRTARPMPAARSMAACWR